MARRRHRREGLGSRLIRGGLPSIAASGVTAFVPLLGAFFVTPENYAIWALGATIATIFVVFDFGAPSLATKLAGTESLNRSTCIRLALISIAPPIILGGVTVAFWPLYRDAAGLGDGPMQPAVAMFVLVAIGCALRSVGLVLASSALGSERYVIRGMILVSGAIAQFVVTLAALLAGAEIVSLGLGVFASGVMQFFVGYHFEFRRIPRSELGPEISVQVKSLTVTFVRDRGMITLIGLAVTQLDRWALGLVGDPVLLAQYDIASRLLAMPKVALVAFATGLISEASRATSLQSVYHLWNKTTRAMALLVPVAMLLVSVAALVTQGSMQQEMNSILLVVVLAVAHGTNSLTIPPAFVLTGLGRPGYELRYLVPLAIGCTGIYASSIYLGNGVLFVLGWAAVMAICSIFFVLKGRSYVESAWRRQSHFGSSEPSSGTGGKISPADGRR